MAPDELTIQSGPAATELDDSAAVTFVGASGGELLPLPGSLAFGGCFQARFAAGVSFAVEGLRDWGGAADIAEEQDFDLEVAAVVGDA